MFNRKLNSILVVFNIVVVGLVVALLVTPAVRARGVLVQTAPHTISYQGTLTDAEGNLIDGTRNLMFQVYDSASGGTLLWQENHVGVSVEAGAFAVVLGSQTALPEDLFDEAGRWLEIWVNGAPLSPRQQFTAVPYAFNADRVDGFDASELMGGGLPSGATLLFPYGSTPTGFTPKPNAMGEDLGPWTQIAQSPSNFCSHQLYTGDRVFCWSSSYGGGEIYTIASDTWTSISVTNAPTRTDSTFWTGTEMISWASFEGYDASWNPLGVSIGARYNPTTNTWTEMADLNSAETYYFYAFWTGSRLLIWKEYNVNTYETTYTGFLYDPATNTWTAMSTAGAPTSEIIVKWVNGRLVVWDYESDTGAIYNPTNDTWTPMSMTNAPDIVSWNEPAVNDTSVIVWGPLDTGEYGGGLFNPVTNVWTPMAACSGCSSGRPVWTDTSEVAIVSLGALHIYNPATQTWRFIDYRPGYVPETSNTPAYLAWGNYLLTSQGIFDLVAGRRVTADMPMLEPIYPERLGIVLDDGDLLWVGRTNIRHTIELYYPYTKD
ncbi:MAG: hypothetical protein JXD18_14855 [Anaerolineae bacterium]|nr:hypothetical protein [Anaerolineae bacterium]